MKVIYNTCFADPWVEVAKKLKKDFGYEPVYWNGYHDDNSEVIIPETFPKVIYHSYYDSWKGNFPQEITDQNHLDYIDVDFLRDYASFELQAIKMMDRMDPNMYSFNFSERQRHFRNYIRYWGACIKQLEPDMVISAVVPHRVYDYALYLQCKFHNIPYITFRETAFNGRIIPLIDVAATPEGVYDDYISIVNTNLSVSELKNQLSPEIKERYEKVLKDYDEAIPQYMKQHVVDHGKRTGLFSLALTFFRDMFYDKKERYWGESGYIRKGVPTYLKERNKSIENSYVNLIKLSLQHLSTNRYKKSLKKHYISLVTEPDFSEKYVIMNFHYQPEMTSCPSGDIFVDQQLCVEALLKNLPEDYYVYVKEHPAQFYSHQEGHTSRIKDFYTDLSRNKRVKLISPTVNSFDLTKNSKAVATVTGTVGWEAMAMGKPSIIFGLSWFEHYPGVLRITDENSAKGLVNFIENFSFSEKELLAYLTAFQKHSISAYYYRGLKNVMSLSEEECVNNIISGILKMKGMVIS